MQIVATSDALTAPWMADVLGVRVRAVRVETFQGGVFGRMARVSVDYVGEAPVGRPTSVIVKYATDDPGSLGLARAMNMYELEVSFYRDVAPLVPDFSVPACHGAAVDPATGMFTLVLEDLSTRTERLEIGPAATTGDRVTACRDALAELVRFQAPLWNSPRVAKLDWLADGGRTVATFEAMGQGLAPFLARFARSLTSEHIAFFERFLPRAGEWVRGWDAPTVVQHGDFRNDNLLVAAAPGTAPVTVIDFQTVRLGPPGVDVAYLVGSTFSTEERREHERTLIAEYHAGLVAAGVGDFSFEDCWTQFRTGALYGAFLFVGLAAQVESVPEIDAYIALQAGRYADMAIDLDAPAAAGLA